MRIHLCVAGLACLVAGHATATDLPRVFMTSVSGNGDLSTWPDAHGLTGLAAADEICRTRAEAATLADADQYIALLSDSHDDAYCRWHGDTGKRAANCNQAVFPTGAGPWYRMDDLAQMDVAQNAVGDGTQGGYVPRHILYDELGTALDPTNESADLAFTATTTDGTGDAANTCGDWTSASGDVGLGNPFYGFGNIAGGSWTCDQSLRLICMEKGQHGPPLPRAHPPSARVVFTTSSAGSGDLSSWADAGGATSLDAADNICRAHAARAGLALPDSFKAWLSTSSVDAIDRIVNDGVWYRVDGVRFAGSIAGLVNGLLEAPPQLDENGRVAFATDSVWTGTTPDGRSSGSTCTDWNDGTDTSFGGVGQDLAVDSLWTKVAFFNPGCSDPFPHLYCLADNDSLFRGDFD
ncbi:MAG TPA: hypothetical protein VKB52_16635 [Rhodanobacteraceae bacterium]|nr:hypothetical protein [Rhodanobacteraceae bacterium]